jgi:N-acetylneuraminate synthase
MHDVSNCHWSESITIDGRSIGYADSPYIIAELSGNHRGELSNALAMIDAAKAAGADAIKIQSYTPDTITLNHDGPEFMITGGLWAGRTLYDLYSEAYTPFEWHEALFAHAKAIGITLFSSPFDHTAVELLGDLDCPAYKVASFEITDIPLLQKIARTGKPVIMSTGLATLAEIAEAVAALYESGCRELAILHCISGYPTPLEDCHLATIKDLQAQFNTPVGLSDHTKDNTAAAIAVSLGAAIIEKHFILDPAEGGVDAEFSLPPAEFAQMVQQAKLVKRAIGKVDYAIKPSETGGRAFRRSLYWAQSLRSGETITASHIRSVRPGLGVHPRYLDQLIGTKVQCDVAFGSAVTPEHVSVPCAAAKDI